MRSSLDLFADAVMALAALALGTAVGLAPLAVSGTRDPLEAGASYVSWLVGGLISAAVVASLDPNHSVRHAIAVAVGFPLGFMLLVALTPMALPNLFPLTAVLLAFVGVCAAFPGAALGRRLAPSIGDWSAEGRVGIGWVLIAAGAVAASVFAQRATVTVFAPPAPSPAAVVAGNAPATPLRVVEVTLRAEPSDYSGRCPTLISFRGRILTAGGRGPLAYRFTRSDNATAPIQRVEVDSSLSTVETTWTLGGPGWSFEGWQALSVLEPQPVTSAPARFRVRCAP